MAGNVPKIRFPGFTEPWEQRKLGDFSHKVTRKNESDSVAETFTNSAERGIVSQTEFFDKEISNPENTRGYYVVKNNDFVYNPRISNLAPCGPVGRNKLNRSGIMSPLYTVFSVKGVDYSFLEFFFKSDHWHLFMYLNGDTGARADRFAIKDKVFFDMPITVPKIHDEQKMIGDFLTDFDLFITLHQRKLDDLKKFKSGLLQKMFPKAGETVPEVRFPEFTGDWEQRKLGEIGFIQTGNTPSTANEKHYSTSGIPWITPSDIYNQVVSVPSRYLSEEGRTAARTAPSDSILVTCIASIGKNALINEESGFNQQINSLTPLEEFDPYFLFIDSYHWSETMRKIAASQTMPIINKTEFSKLTTKITNLKEQQKIGKFFRKIDSAIALHQRT